MSVNLEYQHVSNLPDLSADGVLQIVGTVLPPCAEHYPALIATYGTILLERHEAHLFVLPGAFVEEQLRILQMQSRFHLLPNQLNV